MIRLPIQLLAILPQSLATYLNTIEIPVKLRFPQNALNQYNPNLGAFSFSSIANSKSC